MKSCVRKKSRSIRSRLRLRWDKAEDFSAIVTTMAQSLKSGQFRQVDLLRVLESRRLNLPWEQSDTQIQESLTLFDDDLQFDIQRILYDALSKAYEAHYPDCGGTRGVMMMLALMKSLSSLEAALGVDFADQRSATLRDPFWYG